MKKKKFLFACGGALLALSIPVIASTNGGVLTLFGYNANADGGLYSLTLNRNTNTLDFEGDTTSVTTTLGNHVNFTHSGVTKLEGKVGVLAADGYIQNTERITGMTSITVQFSGTLTIEYAWENTTMLVKEELTSGAEYTFYDKAPSYFKLVNTGAEEAEIDLIDINYSCEYTIKKVVQINYLYKETSEEISSPTYLILDPNEYYGEAGVSGKGKLPVGSKTYVPNLFYVAGYATENKVVDITYTEASVYDGTYDPATDTTRVLEGEGTEASPYQLNCVEDLIWAEAQTHGFAKDSVTTLYYSLNTSVDMTGYTKWTGFCNKNLTKAEWSYLGGMFDGNGYTVAGMNVSGNYTGLGFIATAKNFTLQDLTIEGSVNSTATSGRCGALGYYYNTGTKIKNIAAYVDVTATGTSDKIYVGGLCGSLAGAATNCVSYGKVYSSGTGQYTAGLFAYSNKGTATDCISYSDVTGASYTGGIMGQGSTVTVTNCVNYGNVSGTNTLGGIIGYSSGDVINSVNNGEIIGDPNNSQFVGGIIGQYKGEKTITRCVNNGNISGKNCVGGLAGTCLNSASIYDSINYGDVSAAITGKESSVGGIAGNAGASNYPSIIGDCESYGNVTGKENGVAGIVGWLTNASKIYGCVFGGKVENTSNASNTGAFAGYAGNGCFVSGADDIDHPATEEYPTNTVLVGAIVEGVSYPTPGSFVVVGYYNDSEYASKRIRW